METQINPSMGLGRANSGAKDFFINLGAIIALGVVVGNLISLLFTAINKTYPVTTGYNYYGSYSISWPVASLIVFFPIFILLMWLLEKGYAVEPEKRNIGIRKWLTYITLFLAGLAFAIDLIYVLYYFIDGQEMTAGFILKALTVLVVSLAVFFYYISDILGRLNPMSRKVWTGVALVIILGSIIWGFSVLGSPRTQRLYKYDEQKINDLQSFQNEIEIYFGAFGSLPDSLESLEISRHFFLNKDPQNDKLYEYKKTSNLSYELCAEFNKTSDANSQSSLTAPVKYPSGTVSWVHKAGRYCFAQTINPNLYSKPIPIR